MLGLTSWVQPHIEWGDTLDVVMPTASLPLGAELLVRWPATEFETTDTDCFTLGDQIWIWQPEVGAVRFSLYEPRLFAFPWPGGDLAWFRQVVTRSWLPAIYPLWGRQVLHASAVVCAATGDAVAFTGSTHAGKSTIAYGVSRRPGWRTLCDDTLAFSVLPPHKSPNHQIAKSPISPAVLLHPLPNEARLRPASAEYYGKSDQRQETLTWPDRVLRLRAVYAIEGDAAFEQPAEFTPLKAAEALPLLLQQAFSLSFKIPKYNQQLMKDYLALAAGVPMFSLRYRRSFDVAEELFRLIEEHLASQAGVVCR